jgi:4-carboxymuconolactone decarboxylase
VIGDMSSRLTPLTTGEWEDGQLALLRGNLRRADRYLSGDADAPPIPPILSLLARHPELGGPWLAFQGALIEGGSLDARDRELLILRVGHRMDNRYLRAQHVSMGKAAGLTQAELAAVSLGEGSEGWDESDRNLLAAADELLDQHRLSDPTWSALSARFNEQQMFEVLFVVGSYACLSMVLNSVGLEAPPTED